MDGLYRKNVRRGRVVKKKSEMFYYINGKMMGACNNRFEGKLDAKDWKRDAYKIIPSIETTHPNPPTLFRDR